MRHRLYMAALNVAGLALAFAAPSLGHAQTVDYGRAKAVFGLWCAPCHGPAGGRDGKQLPPGSEALRVKYKGLKPPLIEERTDLPPELTKLVVRHGVSAMPFFRKTEVSDADLDAVAAYLARNTKP